MSIFDNTTRSIELGGSVYFLKVQGYQFPAEKDPGAPMFDSRFALVLKTYIEIVVTPLGAEKGELIGMLARSVDQATEPSFVKLSEPRFHDLKAEFIGDEGFNAAKVQLANFSHNALLKAIDACFLGGGIERDFVFDLCWFNVFTRRFFSIDRLELKLTQAPQEYTHDRVTYTLAQTEPTEDGLTHCVYIPSGKYSTVERDYVLKTYRRNTGSARRWLPVNELRMKLFKAPPFFTDQGIRYQLEGKTIEAEDGIIYANYIPLTEEANKGESTNGIL